jgi:hypothetical protein
MRLTAIGVPRQFAFRISPKEPFPITTAFVKSNSSGLISQSALFVRGGGIVFGSKWLPVFPYRKIKYKYEGDEKDRMIHQPRKIRFMSQ